MRGMRIALAKAMAIGMALLLLPSLLPGAQAYVPPEGIYGMVTDGTTGNPLVGALVTGGGTQDYTDEAGYYYLIIQQFGTWTVTASKWGFTTQSKPVTISRQTGFGVGNFAMAHQYGVWGRVRSADNSAPIPSADMLGYFDDGFGYGWHLSTTTDANGFYHVHAAAAVLEMMADKDGYWSHHRQVTIGWQQSLQRDFYLKTSQEKTVIVSGVFVNKSMVNPSTVTLSSVQYLITTASNINFAASGGTVFGFGGSLSLTTTQSNGQGPMVLPTGYNAIYTVATVEVSGICEGVWGVDYHEVNKHIRHVHLLSNFIGTYTDIVKSTDSRYGTTMLQVGPNGATWNGLASEVSASVTSAFFKVKGEYSGVPYSLDVTVSTSSATGAQCGFFMTNTDTSKSIYFKYFHEANQSGKGIFLHLCYYSFA